jgi:hypothetical protein
MSVAKPSQIATRELESERSNFDRPELKEPETGGSELQQLEITNPKACKALMDEKTLILLWPFMDQACSIKQAATLLERSVKEIFRPVQRLLGLGLLRIEREEVRRGKTIRYYVSPALEFIIPAASIPFETYIEKLEGGLRQKLLQSQLREWLDPTTGTSVRRGLRIFRTDQTVFVGAVNALGEPLDPQQPDHPLLLSVWKTYALSPANARAFHLELRDLLARFEAKIEQGQQAHIVHLAVAPMRSSDN